MKRQSSDEFAGNAMGTVFLKKANGFQPNAAIAPAGDASRRSTKPFIICSTLP